MKPGIYTELSNQDYHSGPGLSSSGIKELLRSGSHYQAYLREPKEQSKEMLLGSLVHSLLLEPDELDKHYHVGEHGNRTGAKYELALKEANGRTVINRDDLARGQEIAEAFRNQAIDHPYLNGERYALLDGTKEQSFYCTCPRTGLLLKARTDNITKDGLTIGDIKTTSNASVDAFQKSIVDYGYVISAAFYLRVVKQTIIDQGLSMPIPTAFTMVAIETKAPFAIRCFNVSEEALRVGNILVDRALDTLVACSQTNVWDAYPKDIVDIGLPNWALWKYGVNNE